MIRRKPVPKKLVQKITSGRIVRSRSDAQFFRPTSGTMSYLLEVATAANKRRPIGTVHQRFKSPEEFRGNEEKSARIICNEFFRTALRQELADPKKQKVYAQAKKTLLQIFSRTYSPGNSDAYVQLEPEEIEVFKKKEGGGNAPNNTQNL